MKIVLYDPYLRKFTDGMEKWWLAQGHEVKLSRYYDPKLVAWGDLIWFDTADNNLKCATDPPDNPDFAGYDMHDMDLTGKRVVVRPIDIEVWQGHQFASKWDIVDEIIFIAPHIREVFNIEAVPGIRPQTGIHTIPHSVDLDRWTYKERGPGFDVAIVSEKWNSKGTHLLLQVILKLQRLDNRYKFHWLGQRSDTTWEYAYFDEFVEHHKLNIEFTNILNDGSTVDDFLEGKNYLLHGSVKEAFSAATAEAMAKGIRPVPHRFFGADGLWPGLTWDTVDEAVAMITGGEYDSPSYRQYLLDKGYDLPSMMARIDKVIKGEEK